MRDVIAVLDGMNVSASAGGNYSGGSSWAAGFPTMPSSEGLAALNDSPALAEYLGMLASNGNGYVAQRMMNPSASAGGNYSGGSSWAAGFPTYPSSQGLASMAPMGYEVTRMNPSASGGANYSGGSSWAAGFPTYPSSEGLAAYRVGPVIRAAQAAAAAAPESPFAAAYHRTLAALRRGGAVFAGLFSYTPAPMTALLDGIQPSWARARAAGLDGPGVYEQFLGITMARITHFAESSPRR
jgi:hypothetical protein